MDSEAEVEVIGGVWLDASNGLRGSEESLKMLLFHIKNSYRNNQPFILMQRVPLVYDFSATKSKVPDHVI